MGCTAARRSVSCACCASAGAAAVAAKAAISIKHKRKFCRTGPPPAHRHCRYDGVTAQFCPTGRDRGWLMTLHKRRAPFDFAQGEEGLLMALRKSPHPERSEA